MRVDYIDRMEKKEKEELLESISGSEIAVRMALQETFNDITDMGGLEIGTDKYMYALHAFLRNYLNIEEKLEEELKE